ncbi:MAG: YibE/F family protein [Acidimicrobiales bacterium]|nr:YibE/F family protein [Acidimicrobiales bacterium]
MHTGHSHGHGDGDDPAPKRIRRLLAIAIAPFGVATIVLVVMLWPREPAVKQQQLAPGFRSELVPAEVVSVETHPCPTGTCATVMIRPSEGPEAGQVKFLPEFGLVAGTRAPAVGDRIITERVSSDLDPTVSYNFVDYERSASLSWLALLFAVTVVVVGRWRGLAAIVGLLFTWGLLTVFVIPAIIEGRSPVLVACASGSLIMFVVLYLAHGIGARTTTALLGTLASLVLTAALAYLFVGFTSLTGLGSDEAVFIQSHLGNVELDGILLAGIVIGALGALNDVTVTQASAVWEVHRADPSQSARRLYQAGMRVGRDHIASTVDTLVLAYAGSSLPLLLLFATGTRPWSDVITGEVVAEEVVRTLVGSIGLVASVPITTALAAFVVANLTPRQGLLR